MICKNCGTEIGDSFFCFECGAKVESDNAETTNLSNNVNDTAENSDIEKSETENAFSNDNSNNASNTPVNTAVNTIYEKNDTKKKIFIAAGICIVILAVIAYICYTPFMTYRDCNKTYNKAVELYNTGEYESAMLSFRMLDDFKDSVQKAADCNTALYNENLNYAIDCYNKEDYLSAITYFDKSAEYIDSDETDEWIEKCYEGIYQDGLGLYNSGKYTDAATTFSSISGYKDADEMADEAISGGIYATAVERYNEGDYDGALEIFSTITGYNDVDSYIDSCNAKIELKKCGQAYINYIYDFISVDAEYDLPSAHHNFAFIYIDNDEIPELYVGGVSEAEGDRICVYNNGSVSEYHLHRLNGMTYLEREGMVCNYNGNMGAYSVQIYSLSNGVLTELGVNGYVEEVYDENIGSNVNSYKWNGIDVSEAEFDSKWNSIFDTSRSKKVTYTYTASEAISYINSNF